MLFKSELIEKIKAGDKTQTRRPVKPGQEFVVDHRNGDSIVSGRPSNRTLYRVGQDYAVQPGRGKPQVARILITWIQRQRLGDISEDDARCEGFPGSAAFIDYWTKLYGVFDPDILVWVLCFELVEFQTVVVSGVSTRSKPPLL